MSEVLLRYERDGDHILFQARGLSNHEARAVLAGIWSCLDRADRLDFIGELVHYAFDPDAYLSPISQGIHDGPNGPGAIDLERREAAEHREDEHAIADD